MFWDCRILYIEVGMFLHLQLDGHYASPASNFVKTNQ